MRTRLPAGISVTHFFLSYTFPRSPSTTSGLPASAEAEIAEASAELDRLALRAVLAGDQSASEATARLDAVRQRRDLLTRALVAAEENERTSREALNARENQARKRALAQHSAYQE